MTISYQVEQWSDVFEEMSAHFKAHHQEIAMDHEAVPLDINLDFYHQQAADGFLHLVTVRDDGLLVGYHLSFVKPHPRYQSTLHAFTDVFYLAKPYRRGLIGYRLFQYVERTWQERGVKKAIGGCKMHLDLMPLYSRLQWRETERVFTKVLKE